MREAHRQLRDVDRKPSRVRQGAQLLRGRREHYGPLVQHPEAGGQLSRRVPVRVEEGFHGRPLVAVPAADLVLEVTAGAELAPVTAARPPGDGPLLPQRQTEVVE